MAVIDPEEPAPTPSADGPASSAAGVVDSARRAWPGLLVVASTLVWAFVAGRRLWFFSDDWNIVAGYHRGHLLDPFNSHLSLVPVGIYQALFRTFGLDSYVPFRLVGLAAYAVLGWVTWRFARERLGAVGAALATAAVLWNSGGVTNVMFPFLMNFSLPIAALAAVWWHLDRRTIRHDAAASAWLIVALATSGLGLMTAVAVGVELAWVAIATRRIDGRRWAILAPGPVLWLAWYAKYGVDSPASGGLRPVVSYSARMLWGGFGSLVGGNRWLALPVALAFAGLVVVVAVRRAVDGRIAGALAAPVAFAVLTAVSRIGVVPAIPPDELRYRWTIGAFVVFATVLLLAAVIETDRVADRGADRVVVLRPQVLMAMAAIAAVAIVVDAGMLAHQSGDWARTVETATRGVRANLWEAEAAQAAGVLDRDRALPVSYVKVTAGEYVDAVADLGSPLVGFGRGDFGANPDSANAADQAFVDDFGVRLEPAVGPAPTDPSCGRHGVGDTIELTVEPGTTARIEPLDAPVEVRFLLFGHETAPAAGAAVPTVQGVPLGTATAGAPTEVRLPALPAGAPVADYRLVFSGYASVTTCSA